MSCEFSGEETFDEVCSTLSPNVRSIDEYCYYLKKIPNLTDFFCYKEIMVKK
jgi:hypothetical protein